MKKFYFLFFSLILIIAQQGSAQTQFWTGAGTWNTTNTNWGTATGGPYTHAWASGLATFEGTAGIVTIGAPVSATGLTFNKSAYSLSGSNVLTLTGIPTITIGTSTTNYTTEFDAQVSASGQITIANATTGTNTINFGPVAVATSTPFSATNFSGGIVINTGISRINGNNQNAFGTSGNAGTIIVKANNLTISNIGSMTGTTGNGNTIFNPIQLNPNNTSNYIISLGGTKPNGATLPFLINYKGAITEGGSGTSGVSLGNTPATGAGAGQGSGACMFSSNANTYKGKTIFNSKSGYFQCGIDNCLPPTTQFVFGDGTGGYGLFDLNGFNVTVGSIETNGAATGSITNSGATLKTLTIGGGGTSNTNATFVATIGANSTTVGSTTLTGTDNIALTLAPSAGTLTLTGPNSFTGGLTVSGGTIQMGATSTLGSGGALPVTLDGGTFSSGATVGFSENLGTLNVTNNSSKIILGTGSHTITFAASGGITWGSGTLTITGWQGNFDGTTGTAGQIFFPDATASSLTATQLSQITFKDASNNLHPAKLIITGGQGELVADVIVAPALSINPASISFSVLAVGASSSSQSFNLSGSHLTGFPGNITVTAPSTNFQVSNDNSIWGASTTIAYSSANLSSTPVYVRFVPQTGGFKSGNITIAGGGATIPPTVVVNGSAQATYTSIATGNWSDGSIWQGGIAPQGGADIIVIQNGNIVTLNASDTSISSLTINGTLLLTSNAASLQVQSANGADATIINGTLTLGSALNTTSLFTSLNLTVGNGGVFTNSVGNALAVSVANFNVNNGGTYNHDAVGSILIGATTDFPGSSSITLGNTSNVVITKWGQDGGSGPNQLPATTYGNLTLNVGTALTGKWGQSAHISTINGTLNVIKTGSSATFYFAKSQALPTITIGGDLNISGGFIGTVNSTSFTTLNVGGNVNVSGGTLDLDGDTTTQAFDGGTVVVNIAGNLSVSGTGTIVRTGGSTALAQVNFNKTSGVQTFSSTPGGINLNKISWNVGDGVTTNALQLNSDFIMSGKSLLTVNSSNSIICGTDVAIDSTLSLLGSSTIDLNNHTLSLNLNSNISGSGTLSGSSISNLTISGTAGVLNFTSGATLLKNLILNSGATATLGTALDITAGNSPGSVTVASGATLTTGGNLTIKSDDNGTAWIGNSAGTITGNVTVERYIPANSERAWRLLSIPTQTTQTIHQAWQENQAAGVVSTTGLGTNITSPIASWSEAGFDAQTFSSSMLKYKQSTNTWDSVINTGDAIATTSGYFIYIRGDRTQSPLSSASPTTATTLRTTGTIYQGTQSPISVPSNEFGLIGNIYASAIDFTAINKDAGIDNKFYVWDPNVLNLAPSLGGYVTFSSVTVPSWIPVPGGGSYTAGTPNTAIQSGQAFFVHASSTGNVTLSENSKVTGSALVFRPETPSIVSGQLITNLYEINNAATNLADGNVSVFNSVYSSTLDGNDALKLSNTQENFTVLRNGKALVIEARQPLTINDTIYFDMWNMKQQQYKLEFVPTGLSASGVTGILEDSYLGTKSPVSLTTRSSVLFTVDANAASSASSRFRIVFNTASPLPVTFTAISAHQNNNTVEVVWKVSGENGIQQYEVEYSKDGINFSEAATVAAKTDNDGAANYIWTDASPSSGNNYYRIKSIGLNNVITYTSIVKVSIGRVQPSITIYPNPVEDGHINLQLTDQQAERYTIQLFTVSGQLVSETQFDHLGGSSSQQINVPSALARGNYQLKVLISGKENYIEQVIIK
jgi:hypothetical protein